MQEPRFRVGDHVETRLSYLSGVVSEVFEFPHPTLGEDSYEVTLDDDGTKLWCYSRELVLINVQMPKGAYKVSIEGEVVQHLFLSTWDVMTFLEEVFKEYGTEILKMSTSNVDKNVYYVHSVDHNILASYLFVSFWHKGDEI